MRRPASTAQLELPLAAEPAPDLAPARRAVTCAGCGWFNDTSRCPVCGAHEPAPTAITPASTTTVSPATLPTAPVLRLPPLRRARRGPA